MKARRATSALAVLLVLGIAVAIYFTFGKPVPELRVNRPTQEWFAERTGWFEQQSFVSLRDNTSLATLVATWCDNSVARAAVPQRDRFAEAARLYLASLSSNSWSDYLTSVRGRRSARTDPSNDPYVHTRYRSLVGEPMPPGISTAEIAQALWTGHPDSHARPVSVGSAYCLSFAKTPPGTAVTDADPGYSACNSAMEAYVHSLRPSELSRFLDDWQAPMGQGLIRLTTPAVELGTILPDATTDVAWMRCVIKTSDADFVILDGFFYFSPSDSSWYLNHGAVQYWKDLFWVF